MTTGRGGVWPNDDVITEIQIFWKIRGISQGILLKFSPKFSNSGITFWTNGCPVSSLLTLTFLKYLRLSEEVQVVSSQVAKKGLKVGTSISGFVYTSLTLVSRS